MKYLAIFFVSLLLVGCNGNRSNGEADEIDADSVENVREQIDSLTDEIDESATQLETDIEKTEKEVEEILDDIESEE